MIIILAREVGGHTQHHWSRWEEFLALKIYEDDVSMCTRTWTAQKMPVEYETQILESLKFVISVGKKSCFELGQAANMDEVTWMKFL
jgi:hypothetical protein